MTTQVFQITLPMPPGVNQMYVNRASKGARGRMISPEYVSWRRAADDVLRISPGTGNTRFQGPVSIYLLCQETKGLSDLDNKFKPILDWLVKRQIIKGDDKRYVRAVSAQWTKAPVQCRVMVHALEGK